MPMTLRRFGTPALPAPGSTSELHSGNNRRHPRPFRPGRAIPERQIRTAISKLSASTAVTDLLILARRRWTSKRAQESRRPLPLTLRGADERGVPHGSGTNRRAQSRRFGRQRQPGNHEQLGWLRGVIVRLLGASADQCLRKQFGDRPQLLLLVRRLRVLLWRLQPISDGSGQQSVRYGGRWNYLLANGVDHLPG